MEQHADKYQSKNFMPDKCDSKNVNCYGNFRMQRMKTYPATIGVK